MWFLSVRSCHLLLFLLFSLKLPPYLGKASLSSGFLLKRSLLTLPFLLSSNLFFPISIHINPPTIPPQFGSIMNSTPTPTPQPDTDNPHSNDANHADDRRPLAAHIPDYAGKSPFPAPPSRFTPRTPLQFLSNSPTNTDASAISCPSYILPTLPSSAASLPSLDPPSSNDRLAMINRIKSLGSYTNSPATVKIPLPTPSPSVSLSLSSRGPATPSSSIIRNKPHMPSPLNKLDYLYDIPPSPPISADADPGQLLVMPRMPNPDVESPIASPFVNLNLQTSTSSNRKPGVGVVIFDSPPRRRISGNSHGPRRGSALANEWVRGGDCDGDDHDHRNDIVGVIVSDDDDNGNGSGNVLPERTISRIPSPLQCRRT